MRDSGVEKALKMLMYSFVHCAFSAFFALLSHKAHLRAKVSMRRFLHAVLPTLVLLSFAHAEASTDYGLEPIEIAPNTYLFQGRQEHFTTRNGGNIANIAAITTQDGVVLIDTGPSKRYGEQLKAALSTISDQPVVLVLNTHLHPDHFLGNQAFRETTIAALRGTIHGIRRDGDGFADNAYQLIGPWMLGTEVTPPNQVLRPGVREIGGHRLRFLALRGHSDADLAVFDETTGVLFTGDLVFYRRSLTTPHAHIPAWLQSLDTLQSLPSTLVVPGHGPVHSDNAGIEQTRKHLLWLDAYLKDAAQQGLDEAEVLYLPLPKWLRALAVGREEYRRSVSHLYGEKERQALSTALGSPE